MLYMHILYIVLELKVHRKADSPTIHLCKIYLSNEKILKRNEADFYFYYSLIPLAITCSKGDGGKQFNFKFLVVNSLYIYIYIT